jgi:hypothetical protein
MRGHRIRRLVIVGCMLLIIAVLGGVLAAGRRTADYDQSGLVETSDMFDFARAYRNREDPQAARAADLNRDGSVDEFDVFLFQREWNADRDEVLRSP